MNRYLGIIIVSISSVMVATEHSPGKLSPGVEELLAAHEKQTRIDEQPVSPLLKRRAQEYTQRKFAELYWIEKRQLELIDKSLHDGLRAQTTCKDYTDDRRQGIIMPQDALITFNKIVAAVGWAPLVQSQRRTKPGSNVKFVMPEEDEQVEITAEHKD